MSVREIKSNCLHLKKTLVFMEIYLVKMSYLGDGETEFADSSVDWWGNYF